MAGLVCPSCCSAELPRRSIRRDTGGANLPFEKTHVLLHPCWSWYVLGPTHNGTKVCHTTPYASLLYLTFFYGIVLFDLGTCPPTDEDSVP
jgi:hypothetical protein